MASIFPLAPRPWAERTSACPEEVFVTFCMKFGIKPSALLGAISEPAPAPLSPPTLTPPLLNELASLVATASCCIIASVSALI